MPWAGAGERSLQWMILIEVDLTICQRVKLPHHLQVLLGRSAGVSLT
jgi:hypothetical protein